MTLELTVILMYEKGEKVNKICGELGISMPRLYRILRRNKVQLRGEKAKAGT